MAEPSSISTIRGLLEQYGARPQKRFGQNFLVSRKTIERIAAAADIGRNDAVLEIGPGLGALTFELANRSRRVVATEKDRLMARILQDLLKKARIPNVEVVQKDARDIRDSDIINWGLGIENYKLIANLPYYIATPIIRKFLEFESCPRLMVFTIQKEVAERICAEPPRMNILALSVQFYADPQIAGAVPKEFFWPKPKVDGAIIKITPREKQYSKETARHFFEIVRAGFRHPRKKLFSNLKDICPHASLAKIFDDVGIVPNARPAELSLNHWLKIISLTHNT